MVDTVRQFVVTVPMSVVAGYLSDFSRAVEWDPGTVSCTRLDGEGPVVMGSRWRNVSRFAGRKTELLYTLRVLAADRVTFVGVNKTATSTDDIALAEVAGGTRLTYTSHIEFNGLARFADPF